MEQPLIKGGSCNLCSINVSEYVLDPFTNSAYIDYNSLGYDIGIIVKEMDKVLTENVERHALQEQKEAALKWRNIGIGIMGLADLFAKMDVSYGDEASVRIASELMKFIFRKAVLESALLGELEGNFPGYSPKVWESSIMKKAFTEKELEALKTQNTLRNCSLISIAPTGSIGTMLNVSTGVEPFFALSYNRQTDSLDGKSYKINIKAVEEYKKVHGDEPLHHFVTAKDIHWKDRINVQAALQEYCDTGISSTVNLPENTSVEEVRKLYIYAWGKGCKGITIYRDGSRDPVLYTDTPKQKANVSKRPEELEADCFSIKIKGKQFIVAVGLLDGKPYEIFAFKIVEYINIPDHKGKIIKVGKGHYSLKSEYFNIDNLVSEMDAEEQAVTLYSSMLMRHGIDMKFIRKTTKKVNNLVSSFSAAICRILSKYIPVDKEGKCPNCGGNLINEGGCKHCDSCEFSKCE